MATADLRGSDEPRDEAKSATPAGPEAPGKWLVVGGVREGFIPSRGFDPYATNDVLSQWTTAAQRTVLTRGRLALAVGASWDIGGASATSRGVDAGILANRFAATLEARYSPRSFVYGFVRLAPGANVVTARVNDPSAPGTLTTTVGSFSGDASVGAAFSPMVNGRVRVWVLPEIGYSYATDTAMHLAPKDESQITGVASKTDLGTLALSGAFFRVALGMSF